ncbi:snRNA-activating protein complex subunit 3 [Teleopsis dalmanni]|uniref:snRNA-activating protein complex subunit 3 n=1 Tax=Teleopsis dalmanni TaxID=139649 RepID=UPI0018CEAC67|nr:snRNA-activating protein complex subunit 3 [Teleopsis dalmanni]
MSIETKVMEEIMGVEMAPPISLNDFFVNYSNKLKENLIFMIEHPLVELNIRHCMRNRITDEELLNLEEATSLNKLSVPDESEVYEYQPGVSEIYRCRYKCAESVSNLKSDNYLRNSKKQSEKNPFKRSAEIYKMVETPFEKIDARGFVSDLVITVRFYSPRRVSHEGQKLEKPKFAEEFQCLGSNLLTELRDKVSCICGKKRFFDVSDEPYAELPEKFQDPGFFFITDTFYNDMRIPQNADYSAIIREWAKKTNGLQNFNFSVKNMENVRFFDLTVSIGFPQLYQHHGNCQHLFTFSQVEILTPSDQYFSKKCYPILKSYNVHTNRICEMCSSQHYFFVVKNSNRQLHDPAYLCGNCLNDFFYTGNKKIGEFVAYRVRDFKIEDNNAEKSDDDNERRSS